MSDTTAMLKRFQDRFWPSVEVVGRSLKAEDLDKGVKHPTTQKEIVALQATLWKLMSPHHRARFVADLDDENRHRPMQRLTDKQREEALLVEIITKWPDVIGSVGSADRGFAMSIMKSRSKANWWPSDAQVSKMKTIWAERSINLDDDLQLVDNNREGSGAA